jgi:hypothetical protein
MQKATRFLILCSLAVIATFIGCTDNRGTLTRPDAARLVAQSAEFSKRSTIVHGNQDAAAKGVRQGAWDAQFTLTGNGRQYFARVVQGLSGSVELTLASPVNQEVSEVTGITDAPEMLGGKGVKQIEFTWRYADLPSMAKRFASRGGTGTAVARLYDDGWRIQDVRMQTSDEPFPLTSEEIDAQTNDERAIADAAKQVETARQQLLTQATTPTQTLLKQTVRLVSGYDSSCSGNKVTTVQLTDVDIQMADCHKIWARMWMGHINNIWKGSGWTDHPEKTVTVRYWKNYTDRSSGDILMFDDAAAASSFASTAINALQEWRKKFPYRPEG